MDVFHFRTHTTPVGELLSVSSDTGLVKIELDPAKFESLVDELGAREGVQGGVDKQIAQYFAGELKEFDFPLDWRFSSGAYKKAQVALRRIPYAQTVSYAELAESAGIPGAARVAGTACAKNPLPIVVPCHRVVRADGAMGNYAGGVAMKRFLLDLEREVEAGNG